jgi:hypothetical protein
MVTRDVDLVIALDAVDKAVRMLEASGFTSERFEWSVNLKGRSAVTVQLSTEEFYRDFPGRSVPADVHGILMRVASLDDTLAGKMKAWGEPTRRQGGAARRPGRQSAPEGLCPGRIAEEARGASATGGGHVSPSGDGGEDAETASVPPRAANP